MPIRALLHYLIAAVWLVNGLFCKILNFVPRHRDIVARILGEQYAPELTLAIGIGELLVVVWVLSRIRPQYCAAFQIAMVLCMNLIEFVLARDLLLFGPVNAVFAVGFAGLLYWVYFMGNSR